MTVLRNRSIVLGRRHEVQDRTVKCFQVSVYAGGLTTLFEVSPDNTPGTGILPNRAYLRTKSKILIRSSTAGGCAARLAPVSGDSGQKNSVFGCGGREVVRNQCLRESERASRLGGTRDTAGAFSSLPSPLANPHNRSGAPTLLRSRKHGRVAAIPSSSPNRHGDRSLLAVASPGGGTAAGVFSSEDSA